MSFFSKLKKKKTEETPAPSTDGSGEQPPVDPKAPAASGDAEESNKDGETPKRKDFPKRSMRKRDAFIKHARDTMEKHQFDYALEMFASALRHDPGNIMLHEEMYDCAKKRAANGGVFNKKIKPASKFPTDRLLAGIQIAATDIQNGPNMMTFVSLGPAAVEADPDEPIAAAISFWGNKAITLYMGTNPKPKELRDYMDAFEKCEAYDLALMCCRRIITQGGMDDKLRQRLKDLEAGDYAMKNTSSEKGGFRDNVKDMDKQRELEMEDATVKTDETKDQLIAGARAAFEDDTNDLDRRMRLVKALLAKQEQEAENEAIELLEDAHAKLGTYKLKVQADDVRIRQFKRQLKELTDQIKAGDEFAKPALEAVQKQRNTFEMGVFAERCAKYPTDMAIRYELGQRQFNEGLFNDAIGAFQQASADAKVRARAFYYLAMCFIKEDLLNEAVQTVERGIESHGMEDDDLGLRLRYLKMDAFERLARANKSMESAQQARTVASDILQKSISYRDIKDRVAKIKALIEELQG